MKVRVLENREHPDEMGMQLEVGEVYAVDPNPASTGPHFYPDPHARGWAAFRTLGSHHSFRARVEVVNDNTPTRDVGMF